MSRVNQQFDLTGNKQKSNPAAFEPPVRGFTDPPHARTRETQRCKPGGGGGLPYKMDGDARRKF